VLQFKDLKTYPMNIELKILFIGNPILNIISYSFIILLIFNLLRVNYLNPIVSTFVNLYTKISNLFFIFSNQKLNIFIIAYITKFISLLFIFGYQENILTIAVLAAVQILIVFIRLIFFAIIIGVILSWVSPSESNSFLELIEEISYKSTAPARKYIPSAGGLDFSPIFMLIFINLLVGFFINIILSIV